LLKQAQNLRGYGIEEIAWTYPTIVEVIKVIAELNHVILGGEVYYHNGRRIRMTYDHWSVEHRGTGSAPTEWAQYVQYSVELATNYIEQYRARNGDAFWYTVNACDEADYNESTASYNRFMARNAT
jgi:hypothetical protein